MERQRAAAQRLLPAPDASDPHLRAVQGDWARGTLRRDGARTRRWSDGPVRRRAPRARARAPEARRRAQAEAPRARHAHARRAAGRAQEAGQAEGPQALPVLEALSSSQYVA